MGIKNNKELSAVYQILAEQYLFEQYAVRRLDERFAECEAFQSESNDALNQKDKTQLKFISLFNKARIERLNEEEINILSEISNGNREGINTAEFIGRTYEKVLAGDLRPGAQYEFFKNIYGTGILPGKSIIFSFRDKIKEDSMGKIDWQLEEKKNNIFTNVKKQFEKMANENSGIPIYLIKM